MNVLAIAAAAALWGGFFVSGSQASLTSEGSVCGPAYAMAQSVIARGPQQALIGYQGKILQAQVLIYLMPAMRLIVLRPKSRWTSCFIVPIQSELR